MSGTKTAMEIVKNARNLEKDEKSRREALRRAAREEAKRKAEKIREGKRKVVSIVESIVDSQTDQETLIGHCQFLCKQDYEDVNIERSLVNVCGYPMCYADLPKPSSQRYHISLADHKVYDLSERKLFCSNLCYKASCYLKEQLEDEPFWMRNGETSGGATGDQAKAELKIYQENRGARGEEVLIVPRAESDIEKVASGSGEIEADEEDDSDFHGFFGGETKSTNALSKKRQQAKLKSTFVASPYIKERDLSKFAESMSKLTIKEKD